MMTFYKDCLMKLMNHLSVKSRMLILIILPFMLLSMLSIKEISSQRQELKSLKSLSKHLIFNEKFSNYITAMHFLRLNSLYSIHNDIDKSASVNAINELVKHIDKKNSPQLHKAIQKLSNVNSEIVNYTAVDVEEWSDWVTDTLENINIIENKERLKTSSDLLNKKEKIVSQLQWLNYWAIKENWYINLDLNIHNEEYHDELNSLFYRQELYIEQFITMNASQENIELLLKTFSNDSFALSIQFRNAVIKNRAKDYSIEEKNTGRQALNHRLLLIQSVTTVITSELKKEINAHIEKINTIIFTFITGLVLSLMFISYFGISLSRRIITNLNTITHSMKLIEKNHDYSIQINVEGGDELALFSQNINTLISERASNEENLINSKNEAQRANLAKSTFLANMSHEIRTPLNGIIGMSGILSETKLSPIQHDYLNTVETSSQTLLILINDILDISKIEAGSLILHTHSTNVREIIFDTISIGISKATEKNLDLNINLSPNLPVHLLLDDHRIRQILMNLTSNGIKFTHTGHVTITARFEPTSRDKGYIHLSVSDSGIGIDKQAQQYIFKPFTQEDSSITREYGGTGLGLAITSQLIELMGGTLSISSEKNHGSCFSFSIETTIVHENSLPATELLTTPIILMGNNCEFKDDIVKELHYQSLSNFISINTLDEITLLENEKPIVLYCIDDYMNMECKNDLLNLRHQHPDISVVLIQKHKNRATNFESVIDGLITYPLLGYRFTKTLTNSLTFHSDNLSSTSPISGDIKKHYPENTIVHDQEISNHTKEHILIVEDNLVNQKVASLFLSKSGYTFDIANNGQEAVDKFTESETYHLILMDCMMPVKDGFAATKEIRQVEQTENRKKTPIIALTASVLDQDISKCYESGMDDYVAKPFKKETLLEKIMNIK